MLPENHVVPVILSGGSGMRLWPLSREHYPKQLIPFVSDHSLLQETAVRAVEAGLTEPLVICSTEHRFIIAEQLRQLDIAPRSIVLEPVGRNTAPAVAVAACMLEAEDPDALMLVLPSDHIIRPGDTFARDVTLAVHAARAGYLTAIGIEPEGPEPGYGYVKRGAALADCPQAHRVERFVEKPAPNDADLFIAQGGWSWNSGMFAFPVALFLEELERWEPEILESVRDAVGRSEPDLDFVRLPEEVFARCPGQSVDHAVMERTDSAAVLLSTIRWRDVGAWSSLWESGAKSSGGNVVLGDVIAVATTNSYLRSEHGLLATLGVDDLVVVATKDALLVAGREHAQDVRSIVERLKSEGREEALTHRVVYRPWGSYESVDVGPRHQVKHISVKPGQRLSLQTHAHRAEHWVVVSGIAEATRGEDVVALSERMSIDIPVGCKHRLANPGPEWLHLIEIQTGDYLGEDDIVRLDDVYGRT